MLDLLDAPQVDNDADDQLPLAYDPAAIAAYWGRRPVAVATRILQLISAHAFLLARGRGDGLKSMMLD